MPDIEISAMAALTAVQVAADDAMPIVDTSAGAAGSKKIAISELLQVATSLSAYPLGLQVGSGPPIATEHDYEFPTPSAPVQFVYSSGGGTITGIVAPAAGVTYFLWNTGNVDQITLVNESGLSTDVNRFQCVGDANVILGPRECVLLQYDLVFAARWRVVKVRSDVGQGTLIVQQPGGTPGEDEIQIYHDGTNGFIQAGSGNLSLDAVGTTWTFGNGSGTVYVGIDNGGDITLPFGGIIFAGDTVFNRIAANVLGTSTFGLNSWVQSTPGRARVASDVTNATTTFANVTEAVFTAIAGRKYSGHVVVRCEDDVAAEGVKFDWNGGAATMTAFWSALGVIAGGGTRVLGADISTSLAGVMNYSTITGDTVFMIPFSCTADQAGTVQLRQAQNSHAAGTLTVKALSFVMTEDMPN